MVGSRIDFEVGISPDLTGGKIVEQELDRLEAKARNTGVGKTKVAAELSVSDDDKKKLERQMEQKPVKVKVEADGEPIEIVSADGLKKIADARAQATKLLGEMKGAIDGQGIAASVSKSVEEISSAFNGDIIDAAKIAYAFESISKEIGYALDGATDGLAEKLDAIAQNFVSVVDSISEIAILESTAPTTQDVERTATDAQSPKPVKQTITQVVDDKNSPKPPKPLTVKITPEMEPVKISDAGALSAIGQAKAAANKAVEELQSAISELAKTGKMDLADGVAESLKAVSEAFNGDDIDAEAMFNGVGKVNDKLSEMKASEKEAERAWQAFFDFKKRMTTATDGIVSVALANDASPKTSISTPTSAPKEKRNNLASKMRKTQEGTILTGLSANNQKPSAPNAPESPKQAFKDREISIDLILEYGDALEKLDTFDEKLKTLGVPSEKLKAASALIADFRGKLQDASASTADLTDFQISLERELKNTLSVADFGEIKSPYEYLISSTESLKSEIKPGLDEAKNALLGTLTQMREIAKANGGAAAPQILAAIDGMEGVLDTTEMTVEQMQQLDEKERLVLATMMKMPAKGYVRAAAIQKQMIKDSEALRDRMRELTGVKFNVKVDGLDALEIVDRRLAAIASVNDLDDGVNELAIALGKLDPAKASEMNEALGEIKAQMSGDIDEATAKRIDNQVKRLLTAASKLSAGELEKIQAQLSGIISKTDAMASSFRAAGADAEKLAQLGDKAMDVLSGDLSTVKAGLFDLLRQIPAVGTATKMLQSAFTKLGAIGVAAIAGIVMIIKQAYENAVMTKTMIAEIKLDNITASMEHANKVHETTTHLLDIERQKAERVAEAYKTQVDAAKELEDIQASIAAKKAEAAATGSTQVSQVQENAEREAARRTEAADIAKLQSDQNIAKQRMDIAKREQESLQNMLDSQKKAVGEAEVMALKLKRESASQGIMSKSGRVLSAGAAGVGAGAAAGAIGGGGIGSVPMSVVGGVVKGLTTAGIQLFNEITSAEASAQMSEKAAQTLASVRNSLTETTKQLQTKEQDVAAQEEKIKAVRLQLQIAYAKQAASTEMIVAENKALAKRTAETVALMKRESDVALQKEAADGTRGRQLEEARLEELKRRMEVYKSGGVDEYGGKVTGVDEMMETQKKLLLQRESIENKLAKAEDLLASATGDRRDAIQADVDDMRKRRNDLNVQVQTVTAGLKASEENFQNAAQNYRQQLSAHLSSLRSGYEEGKQYGVGEEQAAFSAQEASYGREYSRGDRARKMALSKEWQSEAEGKVEAANKKLSDNYDKMQLKYIEEAQKANVALRPDQQIFLDSLDEKRKKALRDMKELSDEEVRLLTLEKERNRSIAEREKANQESLRLEKEQDDYTRKRDIALEDEEFERNRRAKRMTFAGQKRLAEDEMARGRREYTTADEILKQADNGTLKLSAEWRKELGLTEAAKGEESVLTAEDRRRLEQQRDKGRSRFTENRQKLDDMAYEGDQRELSFREKFKSSNRLTEMGLGGNVASWGTQTAENTRKLVTLTERMLGKIEKPVTIPRTNYMSGWAR